MASANVIFVAEVDPIDFRDFSIHFVTDNGTLPIVGTSYSCVLINHIFCSNYVTYSLKNMFWMLLFRICTRIGYYYLK